MFPDVAGQTPFAHSNAELLAELAGNGDVSPGSAHRKLGTHRERNAEHQRDGSVGRIRRKALDLEFGRQQAKSQSNRT